MDTNATKAGAELRRDDLVHPELSYQIVGMLFGVFNELGYGYREKFYQRAIAQELSKSKLDFKQEASFPVIFRGKKIGSHIFDFLIDNKIVLELKQGDHFSKNDITQAFEYLKGSGLQLAILARFTSKGLQYKRILNINS
jgi:GxxExxY protein